MSKFTEANASRKDVGILAEVFWLQQNICADELMTSSGRFLDHVSSSSNDTRDDFGDHWSATARPFLSPLWMSLKL